MSSNTSLKSLRVEKGYKIRNVDHEWYLGYSEGDQRLPVVPSWASARVISALGDVHVHCYQLDSGAVMYQTWVYTQYEDGEEGWNVAKQGSQHPQIPNHTTKFSDYQLLCTNPRSPKWVKAKTVARHQRDQQRAQTRTAQFKASPKLVADTGAATLMTWEDGTCDKFINKPSRRMTRRAAAAAAAQKSGSITLRSDTSDSESDQEVKVIVWNKSSLLAIPGGFPWL
ncbi:hypothetical protein FRC03_011891 [Tulasnella sp. 419]|nr:hypothetical protein FRC03_011891 [Tulasnella sp. 419]